MTKAVLILGNTVVDFVRSRQNDLVDKFIPDVFGIIKSYAYGDVKYA